MQTNISHLKQIESCHILRIFGYYFILLWIIGTVLNGTLLYTLIRNSKLRQLSTNILIGGLLLSDFIGACFEIPFPALSLIHCRWIFTYTGCVFEAIISYFVGCSNMYILCLISIDRYSIMTRPFQPPSNIIQRTYISIGCIYILSLFWTIMPLLGWSSYDYEGLGLSCSIQWTERSLNVISYNITVLIFIYFIPVMIILITNIRNHRRSFTLKVNQSFVQRRLLIERRVLHTISLVIGFLIAWTPYAILVLIRAFFDANHIPRIMDTIPALFAKTSFIWNPLIFIVRNGNFRHYIPFILNKHRSKSNKDAKRLQFCVYQHSMVK
ncbi:unnamed protein product [Rotaria sp. Silwood2]|nr:unnamed protein product [Rotaria sp. Silwood2]CAF4490446.1 unnamed protein product [Rotaria sp. Silwood2]CAF4495964.1 unnamed protein product [Rotaria sp. Silwood2]